ncbi:hypothetical protein BpHYR1_019110 [Brachionus plicatilis]|uniref:Uncharacterized protein n=1 Tax=Brachionus plicatilis TaxID=10195 RepID=A0A3M7SDQ6_BRAPC|nr:hypothetical protein BpHYR1_019110 [Brachionus plicatilis]
MSSADITIEIQFTQVVPRSKCLIATCRSLIFWTMSATCCHKKCMSFSFSDRSMLFADVSRVGLSDDKEIISIGLGLKERKSVNVH